MSMNYGGLGSTTVVKSSDGITNKRNNRSICAVTIDSRTEVEIGSGLWGLGSGRGLWPAVGEIFRLKSGRIFRNNGNVGYFYEQMRNI